MAQRPNWGLGHLIVEVSRSHTIRQTDTHTHTHTHTVGLSERVISRYRGCYIDNTQQTQETKIDALNGIRTRFPSNQTAADLRLRRLGHGYRLCCNYRVLNKMKHVARVSANSNILTIRELC